MSEIIFSNEYILWFEELKKRVALARQKMAYCATGCGTNCPGHNRLKDCEEFDA